MTSISAYVNIENRLLRYRSICAISYNFAIQLYFIFQAAQYLCPAIFPWVDRGPATEASGRYVMKLVGVLYLLILIFDLIIVCGMGE